MARSKKIQGSGNNLNLKAVSYGSVVVSPHFLKGWKDAKSGAPFQEFLDKVENWNYERGRQFSVLFPEVKAIRLGNKPHPEAVALYMNARREKLIL